MGGGIPALMKEYHIRIDYFHLCFTSNCITACFTGLIGIATIIASSIILSHIRIVKTNLSRIGSMTLWFLGLHGTLLRFIALLNYKE